MILYDTGILADYYIPSQSSYTRRRIHMLSWFDFAQKYALQKNILYDNAVESYECINAYRKYKDELRERHRARIQNLASHVQRDVEEVKRERHRARVLAMTKKVDELVQQDLVIKNQRILVSEISEKFAADKADDNQITCMTTAAPPTPPPPPPPPPPRPTPPPRPMTPTPMRNPTGFYGRARSCGRQRMNMFFTMK
jgi:hypothetical protein